MNDYCSECGKRTTARVTVVRNRGVPGKPHKAVCPACAALNVQSGRWHYGIPVGAWEYRDGVKITHEEAWR